MNDIEVERIRIPEGWLYITTLYKTVTYYMENTEDYVDRQPILTTTMIDKEIDNPFGYEIGHREKVYEPTKEK